jgi:hypothetical protein
VRGVLRALRGTRRKAARARWERRQSSGVWFEQRRASSREDTVRTLYTVVRDCAWLCPLRFPLAAAAAVAWSPLLECCSVT